MQGSDWHPARYDSVYYKPYIEYILNTCHNITLEARLVTGNARLCVYFASKRLPAWLSTHRELLVKIIFTSVVCILRVAFRQRRLFCTSRHPQTVSLTV
jgi:hypothetical protein